MKLLLKILLLLLLPFFAAAQNQQKEPGALPGQYKVQIIVKEKTAIQHDSIFITGNFSNWDSTANKNYLLRPHGDHTKSITLQVNAGVLAYKFHRGSWLSVEKQDNGDEVPDRAVTIHKDTVLIDSVLRWRDQMFTDKWYALAIEKEDTSRVKLLASVAYAYGFYTEYYNADSALFYAQEALSLQQKIAASPGTRSWSQAENTRQLIGLQEVTAVLMHSLGNYPKALELRLDNLKLAEKTNDPFLLASVIQNITNDYLAMKDYQHVLSYGKLADSILNRFSHDDSHYQLLRWNINYAILAAFYYMQLPDSALPYANQMKLLKGLPFRQAYDASTNKLLADIYTAKGDNKAALNYYRLAFLNSTNYWIAQVDVGVAKVFQNEGLTDSALFYARRALSFYQSNKIVVRSWGENSDNFIAEIAPIIADLYNSKGQLDSAYKYLHLSVTLKDSLYNTDKIKQFQTLSFNEASRRQQLAQQQKEAHDQYQTRIKMYGLITAVSVFLLLAFVLYRNNRHKQRANGLLQQQKEKAESTLLELRSTQAQLIQSEKMASLGELTAGIAHEIQNPLNFVNNFSEINQELLAEMNAEIQKGNYDEVRALAKDVTDNEGKINHHGKRADAIVKGMLQHSRSTGSVKEPTDINKLADEYLRLAYHGLRAKDKSFNATLKTDFDQSIGNISIIPQDIGRVILNLITNAFYVVDEKKKSGIANYEPTVTVSTKKLNGKIDISVADNGNGIPAKILDKIFQPFFTTKPTGQGTGLGLSLSYDIVKAHGGELKVETDQGHGTCFTIHL